MMFPELLTPPFSKQKYSPKLQNITYRICTQTLRISVNLHVRPIYSPYYPIQFIPNRDIIRQEKSHFLSHFEVNRGLIRI